MPRAHVNHDRVTGGVFLPSVRRNVFSALTDNKCKFRVVVRARENCKNLRIA